MLSPVQAPFGLRYCSAHAAEHVLVCFCCVRARFMALYRCPMPSWLFDTSFEAGLTAQTDLIAIERTNLLSDMYKAY